MPHPASPAACALIVICATLPLVAQSEAGYRANIGRTAVNTVSGVEVGKILDVALANGIWVYKVNRNGRLSALPVETVHAKDVPPVVVKPPAPGTPATPAARVESLLLSTAIEFRKRLALNGGTLQALLLTSKGLSTEWTSTKCGSFEPEVIGLLQSITRTQKASPAVAGSRTCGTDVRTFALKGETVDRYRSGAIGDPGVRAAMK